MEISPKEVKHVLQELKDKIKFSILVDDVEVYVTNIIVEPSGGLRVEFFTQNPDKEDEVRPHVEACIQKLINDEEQKECKSKGPFSRTFSKIMNILRR
ncbi:head vertex assembly chaperone [Vibrio phage D479]